jgi:carboxymethylenebutenolidase
MREALAAAGKSTSEIIVYPDAGHGFHADYRSSYNAADAADGWRRMLAFLAARGLAPRAFTSTRAL